ncbi:MAG: hydroxymethylbilane synthase, partial [Chloroflexota bacterium]
PAPGQGALAVECRAEDGETLGYLAAVEDPAARLATVAERSFLAALGGGCSLPVAAYGAVLNGSIQLTGAVASLDGQTVIRVQGQGNDPHTLGAELAQEALARGAGEILLSTTR